MCLCLCLTFLQAPQADAEIKAIVSVSVGHSVTISQCDRQLPQNHSVTDSVTKSQCHSITKAQSDSVTKSR